MWKKAASPLWTPSRSAAGVSAYLQKSPCIRAPVHPDPPRCSAVEYRPVFALLAPCGSSAPAPSVLGKTSARRH
jgi:hypothetical protein